MSGETVCGLYFNENWMSGLCILISLECSYIEVETYTGSVVKLNRFVCGRIFVTDFNTEIPSHFEEMKYIIDRYKTKDRIMIFNCKHNFF